MRIARLIMVLVCLSCAGIAGCSAKPGIRSYTFKTHSGENVSAELGTFLVAENRSNPDSRQIPLRFVRFKSTSQNPGPPIVYLAGGPGGSGIETARGPRFPLFMAMREFGDVIAFDQRGTGESGFEELDCDDRFQIPFDQPVQREQAARIVADATRGCLERMRGDGIYVDAYNTRESAADLMDLREFLGAEKLSLWGISYGSHLALAAMKEHGNYIERVILAGIEGLHHTWKLPADQQALLTEFADRVRADEQLAQVVPDLLGSITGLLAELERSPKSVQLTHPIDGTQLDVVVGKFDLQFVLANALRGPETFAAIPDAIARMEQGDWAVLALASAQLRMGEGIHGMTIAMDCASGADPGWYQRIANEAKETLLGDAINFPMREICDELQLADLGADFRRPVQADNPVLLISGTLDGRTPVANAEMIMPGLSNAQHLVIDGAGHSDPLFLSSPQILDSMKSFMRGERIAQTRITLPAVEFVAPRKTVQLDDATLSQYVGAYDIENSRDVRKVIKAGDMLYTRRGRGLPQPIRPTSATEFFYEGSKTVLEFQTEGDTVLGMLVYHEGAAEGEFARKK